MGRGLLPREIAPTYIIPPCPEPLFQIDNALPTTLPVQDWGFPTTEEDVAAAAGMVMPADCLASPLEVVAELTTTPAAVNGPVVRRKSTTPRSVLDFDDGTVINVLAMAAPGKTDQEEAAVGDNNDQQQPVAKRHRAEQELQNWIDTLVM